MSRRKRTTVASKIDFLSPTDCDSTVAYKIILGRYHEGVMSLTDCERKIGWYFRLDKDGLAKIDKVLEIVTAFRADFIAACKRKNRRKR